MRISLKVHFAVFVAIIYTTTQVVLASATESNFWADRRKQITQEAKSNNPVQLAALPVSINTPTSIVSQLPSVGAALPSIPKWSEFHRGKLSSSLQPLIDAIPLIYGSIQDVYDSKENSNPPVLLVQDVHLNPEAQQNISSILQELIDRKELSVVGVEGSFSQLDFSKLRAFPKEALRQVCDLYRDKNLLAAPSYVGLTSMITPPLFIGVDDKDHYKANVQAYLSTRPQKDIAVGQIANIRKDLVAAKQNIFSPEMKVFDALKEGHYRDTIGLGPYIKKIASYQTDHDFVIEQFLSAYEIEQSLDFNQVDHERRIVIENLTKKLSQQEISGLVAQSLAYRMGQIGFGTYYQNLQDLCERKGINLGRTPHFESYIRYVLLTDGIKAEKLFSSIEALEKDVLSQLARSPRELKLTELSDQLNRMEKLLDFSLTPNEWRSYLKEERSLDGIEEALGKLEDKPSTRHDWVSLQDFEKFYTEAETRSQKIVDSLLKQNISGFKALVVGGFHTPEVASLLRDHAVSYVVVSPKITKIDSDSGTSYLSVFAQEKASLDKLFAGEKLFVNPFYTNVPFAPIGPAAAFAMEPGATPTSATGVQRIDDSHVRSDDGHAYTRRGRDGSYPLPDGSSFEDDGGGFRPANIFQNFNERLARSLQISTGWRKAIYRILYILTHPITAIFSETLGLSVATGFAKSLVVVSGSVSTFSPTAWAVVFLIALIFSLIHGDLWDSTTYKEGRITLGEFLNRFAQRLFFGSIFSASFMFLAPGQAIAINLVLHGLVQGLSALGKELNIPVLRRLKYLSLFGAGQSGEGLRQFKFYLTMLKGGQVSFNLRLDGTRAAQQLGFGREFAELYELLLDKVTDRMNLTGGIHINDVIAIAEEMAKESNGPSAAKNTEQEQPIQKEDIDDFQRYLDMLKSGRLAFNRHMQGIEAARQLNLSLGFGHLYDVLSNRVNQRLTSTGSVHINDVIAIAEAVIKEELEKLNRNARLGINEKFSHLTSLISDLERTFDSARYTTATKLQSEVERESEPGAQRMRARDLKERLIGTKLTHLTRLISDLEKTFDPTRYAEAIAFQSEAEKESEPGAQRMRVRDLKEQLIGTKLTHLTRLISDLEKTFDPIRYAEAIAFQSEAEKESEPGSQRMRARNLKEQLVGTKLSHVARLIRDLEGNFDTPKYAATMAFLNEAEKEVERSSQRMRAGDLKEQLVGTKLSHVARLLSELERNFDASRYVEAAALMNEAEKEVEPGSQRLKANDLKKRLVKINESRPRFDDKLSASELTAVVMTANELTNQVNVLNAASALYRGRIAVKSDGTITITLQNSDQYEFKNVTGFMMGEDRFLYVRHLNSEAGYRPKYVRITANTTQTLTEQEAPKDVRGRLGVLSNAALERHINAMQKVFQQSGFSIGKTVSGLYGLQTPRGYSSLHTDNLSGFMIAKETRDGRETYALYIKTLNPRNENRPTYQRYNVDDSHHGKLLTGQELPEEVANIFGVVKKSDETGNGATAKTGQAEQQQAVMSEAAIDQQLATMKEIFRASGFNIAKTMAGYVIRYAKGGYSSFGGNIIGFIIVKEGEKYWIYEKRFNSRNLNQPEYSRTDVYGKTEEIKDERNLPAEVATHFGVSNGDEGLNQFKSYVNAIRDDKEIYYRSLDGSEVARRLKFNSDFGRLYDVLKARVEERVRAGEVIRNTEVISMAEALIREEEAKSKSSGNASASTSESDADQSAVVMSEAAIGQRITALKSLFKLSGFSIEKTAAGYILYFPGGQYRSFGGSIIAFGIARELGQRDYNLYEKRLDSKTTTVTFWKISANRQEQQVTEDLLPPEIAAEFIVAKDQTEIGGSMSDEQRTEIMTYDEVMAQLTSVGKATPIYRDRLSTSMLKDGTLVVRLQTGDNLEFTNVTGFMVGDDRFLYVRHRNSESQFRPEYVRITANDAVVVDEGDVPQNVRQGLGLISDTVMDRQLSKMKTIFEQSRFSIEKGIAGYVMYSPRGNYSSFGGNVSAFTIVKEADGTYAFYVKRLDRQNQFLPTYWKVGVDLNSIQVAADALPENVAILFGANKEKQQSEKTATNVGALLDELARIIENLTKISFQQGAYDNALRIVEDLRTKHWDKLSSAQRSKFNDLNRDLRRNKDFASKLDQFRKMVLDLDTKFNGVICHQAEALQQELKNSFSDLLVGSQREIFQKQSQLLGDVLRSQFDILKQNVDRLEPQLTSNVRWDEALFDQAWAIRNELIGWSNLKRHEQHVSYGDQKLLDEFNPLNNRVFNLNTQHQRLVVEIREYLGNLDYTIRFIEIGNFDENYRKANAFKDWLEERSQKLDYRQQSAFAGLKRQLADITSRLNEEHETNRRLQSFEATIRILEARLSGQFGVGTQEHEMEAARRLQQEIGGRRLTSTQQALYDALKQRFQRILHPSASGAAAGQNRATDQIGDIQNDLNRLEATLRSLETSFTVQTFETAVELRLTIETKKNKLTAAQLAQLNGIFNRLFSQMERIEQSNYRGILGVGYGAPQDQIKKAYRQASLKYHPDRNPGNVVSEAMFKVVTRAYERLGGRILWLKSAIIAASGNRISSETYDRYLEAIENSLALAIGGILLFSFVGPLIGLPVGFLITNSLLAFRLAYGFGWVVFFVKHLGDVRNDRAPPINRYFAAFIAAVNIGLLYLPLSPIALIVLSFVTHFAVNRAAPHIVNALLRKRVTNLVDLALDPSRSELASQIIADTLDTGKGNEQKITEAFQAPLHQQFATLTDHFAYDDDAFFMLLQQVIDERIEKGHLNFDQLLALYEHLAMLGIKPQRLDDTFRSVLGRYSHLVMVLRGDDDLKRFIPLMKLTISSQQISILLKEQSADGQETTGQTMSKVGGALKSAGIEFNPARFAVVNLPALSFRADTLLVDHVEDILVQYNRSLQGALLVLPNGMVWDGGTVSQDLLKSLAVAYLDQMMMIRLLPGEAVSNIDQVARIVSTKA